MGGGLGRALGVLVNRWGSLVLRKNNTAVFYRVFSLVYQAPVAVCDGRINSRAVR